MLCLLKYVYFLLSSSILLYICYLVYKFDFKSSFSSIASSNFYSKFLTHSFIYNL